MNECTTDCSNRGVEPLVLCNSLRVLNVAIVAAKLVAAAIRSNSPFIGLH